MDFMTAASVRNLPGYQNQNRLSQQYQDTKQEKSRTEERKNMISNLALERLQISQSASPEDLANPNFDTIIDQIIQQKFPDVDSQAILGSKRMAMGLQDALLQKQRQGKTDEHTAWQRGEDKFAAQQGREDTVKANRNLSLLNMAQNPQPSYGDEGTYAAPGVEKQDVLSMLDYPVRQQYEKDQAALDLTKSQIAKNELRTPVDTRTTKQKDYEYGLLNPGFDTTEGPTKYKRAKDRMDYALSAVKAYNSDGPGEIPPEQIKQMALIEFDANVGGWGKVSNPETGQKGYKKPNGEIVDIMGNPVAKTTPLPKPTPKPNPPLLPKPTTDPVKKQTTTPWDKTILGGVESAIKGSPQFLKDTRKANTESYESLIERNDSGSSIPGVSTFKRQSAVDGEETAQKEYGKRADGTQKGGGYFGELPLPSGKGFSTEVSIGVNIDGKEIEIPLLVPTLTQDEIDVVLKVAEDKSPIPESIMQKAITHAKLRKKEGKSPFAASGERSSKQIFKMATE